MNILMSIIDLNHAYLKKQSKVEKYSISEK